MISFSLFNSSSLHEFNQLSNKNALRWGVRWKEYFVVLWWEFEGERVNKVQRKTTNEIWLLFLEKLLMDRRRERICLNWRKAERYETYLSETSLWCLYESERLFCKVVAAGIFSFERLKSLMLLILFSFFEVKIPPPILPEVFVLIFANQFHLCQLMFQSLLFAFQ